MQSEGSQGLVQEVDHELEGLWGVLVEVDVVAHAGQEMRGQLARGLEVVLGGFSVVFVARPVADDVVELARDSLYNIVFVGRSLSSLSAISSILQPEFVLLTSARPRLRAPLTASQRLVPGP